MSDVSTAKDRVEEAAKKFANEYPWGWNDNREQLFEAVRQLEAAELRARLASPKKPNVAGVSHGGLA